jgi:hypothetical protein
MLDHYKMSQETQEYYMTPQKLKEIIDAGAEEDME